MPKLGTILIYDSLNFVIQFDTDFKPLTNISSAHFCYSESIQNIVTIAKTIKSTIRYSVFNQNLENT